jgi:RND family efflux transporter MFP subunit
MPTTPSLLRHYQPLVVSIIVAALAIASLRWLIVHSGHSTELTLAPLPVSVVGIDIQDRFTLRQAYTGTLRAGRDAELGFDRGGLLTQLAVAEGDTVVEGDVLATLDTRPIELLITEQQANIDRLKADYDLAELRYQRTENLAKQRLVAESDLDDARLRLASLHAQTRAAQTRLDALELDLEKSRIIAPFSGVIAARYAQIGAAATPGSPVLRLVEANSLEALVGIPAAAQAALELGMTLTVDINNRSIPGTLTGLRRDLSSRTLTVDARLALAPDPTLLPGQSVTLWVPQSIERQGAWIPRAALIEKDRGLWSVLRLRPSEQGFYTEPVSVSIIAIDDAKVYVESTLATGDLIVQEGVHRVGLGTLVTPLSPSVSGEKGAQS